MSGADVKRAEQEVKKSTLEFEHAMEHLEDVVGNASRKIARSVKTVQKTIHKPKEIYDHTVEKTRNITQQLNQSIKDHRELVGVVMVSASLAAVLGYLLGRRNAILRSFIKIRV